MNPIRVPSRGMVVGAQALLLAAGFSMGADTTSIRALPSASPWGGGDVVGSKLIGNSYAGGKGPGIWITSTGGYRLYLNGDLLAWDNHPGRVRFVPLVFLPGTNAVSVVGIDHSGTPGVLLQIDELDSAHVSGARWKANAAPGSNAWKQSSFSDASWSAATASGDRGALPGGAVLTGFASGSSAKWMWTASKTDTAAVLRYVFKVAPRGFGAATTGGAGGSIVIAKTMSEIMSYATKDDSARTILIPEGTYDFRDSRDQLVCVSGGNNVVTGSCATGVTRTVKRWDRRIGVRSNKTIMGLGRGASLRGASFYAASGLKNAIFRNLKVWDVNPHIIEAGDAITPDHSTKVWVDHCTFRWISDGNDVWGSKEHTWSWNMYDGRNEYVQSGRDHYAAALDSTQITYDHFYWYDCEGREPKASQYNTVHVLNNYHEINTYFAIGSSHYSQVRVEGTVFDSVEYPLVAEENGLLWENGNTYNGCGSFQRDWKSATALKDAVFTPSYSYAIEPLSTVATSVKTHAGAGGAWKTVPAYTDAAGLANAGPVVSLNAPSNLASYASGAAIPFAATVSDADGSVVDVSFYAGSTLLCSAVASPWSCSTSSLTPGAYSIVAQARDDDGVTTMSLPVTVIVAGSGAVDVQERGNRQGATLVDARVRIYAPGGALLLDQMQRLDPASPRPRFRSESRGVRFAQVQFDGRAPIRFALPDVSP